MSRFENLSEKFCLLKNLEFEVSTTPVYNIYQKMVNFTVLRNVVLTLSKIIHHFENSQLIITWHKMVSMCGKFHSHTISSLENTGVGHLKV